MTEEKKRDFDPKNMVPADDGEVEKSLRLIAEGQGGIALYGLYLCDRIDGMSVVEAYGKTLTGVIEQHDKRQAEKRY